MLRPLMSLLWGCLYKLPRGFPQIIFLSRGIEHGEFRSFKLSISLLVQLFASVIEYLRDTQLLNFWLAIRGLVRLVNELDIIEVTYVSELPLLGADL